MIEDIFTYTIQIRGQASEEDLNAMSPVHMTVRPLEKDCTELTARTDQAGCIGLVRYLHSLGVLLLSIHCSAGSAFEASR